MIETSELRRSFFSPSRPTLSSSLVVTNIWISLDCFTRSSLWLHALLFFAYSIHSRPVYPFPHCAHLIGCTLALWVVSRAFPCSLASPVYLLARLPSHAWWSILVPYSYLLPYRSTRSAPRILRMHFRARSMSISNCLCCGVWALSQLCSNWHDGRRIRQYCQYLITITIVLAIPKTMPFLGSFHIFE